MTERKKIQKSLKAMATPCNTPQEDSPLKRYKQYVKDIKIPDEEVLDREVSYLKQMIEIEVEKRRLKKESEMGDNEIWLRRLLHVLSE